jgi:hypothetical protein
MIFGVLLSVPPKPSALSLTARGNRYLMLSVPINEEFKRCVLMKSTFIEISCNNEKVVEENVTKIQTEYKFTVDNLRPNTKYSCSARMRNEKGHSEFSDAAEFVTQQDCELFSYQLCEL